MKTKLKTKLNWTKNKKLKWNKKEIANFYNSGILAH